MNEKEKDDSPVFVVKYISDGFWRRIYNWILSLFGYRRGIILEDTDGSFTLSGAQKDSEFSGSIDISGDGNVADLIDFINKSEEWKAYLSGEDENN